MVNSSQYSSFSLALIVTLICTNAYTLIGVLFFGWNAYILLYIYLVEMWIVAIFSFLRMVAAKRLYDPIFARLNPHWVKGYPTKASFLRQSFAFMLIFTVIVSVFTLLFTWSVAEKTVTEHSGEIFYFTLLSIGGNLASYLFFFLLGKGNHEEYASRIFRLFLFRKILPLFLGIFVLIFLVQQPSLFLFVLIGLKTLSDILTYHSEKKDL